MITGIITKYPARLLAAVVWAAIVLLLAGGHMPPWLFSGGDKPPAVMPADMPGRTISLLPPHPVVADDEPPFAVASLEGAMDFYHDTPALRCIPFSVEPTDNRKLVQLRGTAQLTGDGAASRYFVQDVTFYENNTRGCVRVGSTGPSAAATIHVYVTVYGDSYTASTSLKRTIRP